MSVPGDRRALARGLVPMALMAPAAFAVHQLRYLLAFGGSASVELQRQGHTYMHSLVPWLVLLLALAVGGFLRALGRAMAGQTSLPRYTISFAGLWLACSVCLVAIYSLQELLEGLLVAGHPTGLVGIFGYGGWWSIPASVCIGLVLAAAFHGARWVLDEVVERRARRVAVAAPRAASPHAFDVLLPRLAPLAGGWSGRGPPG